MLEIFRQLAHLLISWASQRFLVLRADIMTSYLGRPLHEYVALTVHVFTSLRLVLGPEILSNLI